MQNAAFAALVLAALCACAPGPTHLVVDPDAGGHPIGQGGGDAGDGGADAGDGGPDAGDAGCTALSISSAAVSDNCVGTNVQGTASVNVNGSTCAVVITMTTGTACNGVAVGTSDALDGGCGAFSPCHSSSLPGTIVCAASGMSSCVIYMDGGP